MSQVRHVVQTTAIAAGVGLGIGLVISVIVRYLAESFTNAVVPFSLPGFILRSALFAGLGAFTGLLIGLSTKAKTPASAEDAERAREIEAEQVVQQALTEQAASSGSTERTDPQPVSPHLLGSQQDTTPAQSADGNSTSADTRDGSEKATSSAATKSSENAGR